MKYQKLTSLVLVGALSVTMASPVFAADVVGTTDGTIGFEENDETTAPVDPTDPSKPDPGDNEEDNKPNPTAGPLSLDVIPRQFDFGTQKVSATTQTYNNVPKSANGFNYLQVTDNRSTDNANGWSVNVKMSEFTDGTNNLTGATLILPKGEARNSLTGATVVTDISTRGGSISADDTSSLTVFGVDNSGKGKATSVSTWNASEVQLTVPGGQAKENKTYTSTVTWTLTASVYS